MSTQLRTIALTPYLARVPRFGNGPAGAKAQPAERCRWRAELLQPGEPVKSIEGYETPDGALGALVLVLVAGCESPAEVVELIGGLFGDVAHLAPHVQLGRAIRLAARNPNRKHLGCAVTLAAGGPRPELRLAREGGAL